MNEIYSNDIEKKMIFLQQRCYVAGGKTAKLLAYKLKKQEAENTINKIRDLKTYSIQYNKKDIQQSFATFYKSLYTQSIVDETKTEAFLDLITLPKVGDKENKGLTKEMTDEGIKKAISN